MLKPVISLKTSLTLIWDLIMSTFKPAERGGKGGIIRYFRGPWPICPGAQNFCQFLSAGLDRPFSRILTKEMHEEYEKNSYWSMVHTMSVILYEPNLFMHVQCEGYAVLHVYDSTITSTCNWKKSKSCQKDGLNQCLFANCEYSKNYFRLRE